jgi:hypothetical protein
MTIKTVRPQGCASVEREFERGFASFKDDNKIKKGEKCKNYSF